MGALTAVVLDSNIIIDALNGVEAARGILAREVDAVISVLTWTEVLAGIRDETSDRRTRALLGRMRIVPVDGAIAEDALALRKSTRLKLIDACILATARTSGLQLLTRNTKDFDEHWPGVSVPYRVENRAKLVEQPLVRRADHELLKDRPRPGSDF